MCVCCASGSPRAGDRAYAFAVLGWRAALDLLPEANEWFAPQALPISAQQRLASARRTARSTATVRTAIGAMPAAGVISRNGPGWDALAATRKRTEAEAQYARIAGEPSFRHPRRGGTRPRFTRQPAMPPVQNTCARQKAIRGSHARWRCSASTYAPGASGTGRCTDATTFAAAAARIANTTSTIAPSTAERSSPNANFELRYLTPYRGIIEPRVRNQGLDMSWVYGLIDRRAAGDPRALQRQRAELVRVMPATGKWVANKIGLRDYHAGRLGDPETNVLLGTSYMRLILEGLDNHPVLASAGYNAGPGRARRWRDDKPLEGAIYAETIPFDETRDYVRKVMTNTVIYAAMLEKRPQSLKARLGTIAPRTLEGVATSNDRDLQ